MKHYHYVQLLAEKKALERMLDKIPQDNVIDRGSIFAQIEEIDHQIRESQVDQSEPSKARLTFRGRPVIGSHGIFAEFGMTATKSFADAIKAVAASFAGPLAAMGPIPNRDQNQLLITSTAVGSFGFELEEYQTGQLQLTDQSPIGHALEYAQSFLQGTLGTDDELTASVAGTDLRALSSIRSFLEILVANDAVCALEHKNHTFRFTDVGQVQRSLARLSQDNIHKEEQILTGEFRGVLPTRRTFEFQAVGHPDVLIGRVGPNIEAPATLNDHLHQQKNIKVISTRIGDGRPKYLLVEVLPNSLITGAN